MKALCIALILATTLPVITAQDLPATPEPSATTGLRYSREELKQLVGPIALYPDPLVGLILPASTFPSDIVLAARFVETGDDLSLVDDKPWDVSVRALTRYPDVLKWMDENLEWTTQLGQAYLAQPNDVMDAIQELRAKAQDVGNLIDTPQQKIVREEQYIRIVPADPEYIYVPYYDPGEVYYERPVAAPYLTFGPRWLTGWWLCFDFDWHHRRLYCGDWDGGWDYHHHRDRRDYYGDSVYINERLTNYEVWEGDRNRRRASARTFAELGGRQRTLAQPARFRDRPELASKVESTLAKQDKRWAKRAVSSGLAENSIVKDADKQGKGRKDRLEADRTDARGLTDAQAGKDNKGRLQSDLKGLDERRGKDKGRLETVPSDAPVISGAQADDARSQRDRKSPSDDKGTKGKERLALPERMAPGIGDAKVEKGRPQAGLKGPSDDKGRSQLRETPSGRPEVKKNLPSPDSAPTLGGETRGKGSSAKSKPDDFRANAPTSAPKPRVEAPKAPRSSAPNVRKDTPKPSGGPPTVQKSSSSSKPKVVTSARSSPPKSSGAPSMKKSTPKPKAVASAPRKSSPKPSASLGARSGPSKPVAKPSVRKSAPKPSAAAKRPGGTPKPQIQSSPPKGGGGKAASSNDKKEKKKK